MGNLFKAGTLATRRFAVLDPLPENHEERFVRGIRAHAFMEIDPASEADTSHGWVSPTDSDDVDLTAGKVWRNATELRLGLRTDTLKPPADEVKRQVAARASTIEAEEGRTVSRRERRQLKEQVVRALRRRAFARRAVVQVVWLVDRQRLYLSSQSKATVERFLDLFVKSFGLRIEPEGAARWALAVLPPDVVKQVTPTRELWLGFPGVRPLAGGVEESA